MNDLKNLKRILEVVIHADRELSVGTALYVVKELFEGLIFDDVIDLTSEYGSLLKTALTAKRKDTAMKNFIFSRSCLDSLIKALELEQLNLNKAQKQQDDLAIESTFVDVTRNENKEIQLQLNYMPKKLGRPKLVNALSGAERAKRARDKKKEDNRVTINFTLSKEATRLYKLMENSGHDLNDIVVNAFNQTSVIKG
jgi:hypothetical protein